MNLPPLPEAEEALLRDYAAGRLAWASLRRQVPGYDAVLAGLGRLGLVPPMAPMAGPNLAARERGRTMLRERLQRQVP